MEPVLDFLDALMTMFPLIAAVVLVLTALIFVGAVMLSVILIRSSRRCRISSGGIFVDN